MKFLLKIVQGPNAGAEIALVEGVRVTLGSADSCDIVLADPTLAPEACAIEASADAVTLTPSGAAPEALEPLHVRSFGTTALAVGPADAPWGPLDWAAPDVPSGGSGDDPPRSLSAPATPENADPVGADLRTDRSSTTPAVPSATSGDSRDEAPRSSFRRIGCLVLLLLLLLLAAWFLSRRRAHPDITPLQSETAPVPEAPDSSLVPILSHYGLVSVETNGTTIVRGDFATRTERLQATAALYEASPGIKLDIADTETLLSSTSDLLAAATEGAITVADITNRVAVLAGTAANPAALAATLRALRADVPRLADFDTAAVTLDSPIAPSASDLSFVARHSSRVKAPSLPLCGILLQPYPCLVLQNGRRLTVGAEVGGYKIASIAADRITLQPQEGDPLEWTP